MFNVMHDFGFKHSTYNENFVFLWHQRLGHISGEKVIRLVKGKILYQLDFTNWDICVDCIKGKQTKYTSKHSVASSKPLKLIDKNMWSL